MEMQWFDPQTGELLLDDHVAQMDSYRRILEDRVVSDEEITQQTIEVVSLLKELESILAPDQKELVTSVLCELAVLDALHLKRLGHAAARA